MDRMIEKEEKDIICPICDNTFSDYRGLTSHARNMHGLTKEEIYGFLEIEKEESGFWAVIAGAGVFALALLGFIKVK